jgi:heptosyltransferase-2
MSRKPSDPASPILLIPYMWIGDFVRCHTVVKVLKARWPRRPVDVLTTQLTAPLLDYMPGVRKGVVWDLPRISLALASHRHLAHRLRDEEYSTALVMPRKWKSALAPFLAGIPERTGFVGEGRYILLNDLRQGERRFDRMVDQCAVLALPSDVAVPDSWPAPTLTVPPTEIASWLARRGLDRRKPVAALAPGAIGESKRWPLERFSALAGDLVRQGIVPWVLGGPNEKEQAAQIVTATDGCAIDLTGGDLRHAALALAASTIAVCNDSGLLHVAAAIGIPTIGLFGPTSPRLWAPLNPLAATLRTSIELVCQPCHQPLCAVGHHICMREITLDQVKRAVAAAMPRADLRVVG